MKYGFKFHVSGSAAVHRPSDQKAVTISPSLISDDCCFFAPTISHNRVGMQEASRASHLHPDHGCYTDAGERKVDPDS